MTGHQIGRGCPVPLLGQRCIRYGIKYVIRSITLINVMTRVSAIVWSVDDFGRKERTTKDPRVIIHRPPWHRWRVQPGRRRSLAGCNTLPVWNSASSERSQSARRHKAIMIERGIRSLCESGKDLRDHACIRNALQRSIVHVFDHCSHEDKMFFCHCRKTRPFV